VKPRRVKAASAKRKMTAATPATAAVAGSTSCTTTAMFTDFQYCSVIGMKLAALVKRNQLAVYRNDGSATAGDAIAVSQLLLAVLQQQQLLPAGVTVELDVKNGYMNFNTLNLHCDDATVLSYYQNSNSSSSANSSSIPALAVVNSSSGATTGSTAARTTYNSNTQHQQLQQQKQQQQYEHTATAAALTAVADSSSSSAMETRHADTVHADYVDMMHDDSTDDIQMHSDTTTNATNTLLQFNGLTGSNSILSAQDRDRLMSIDHCDETDDSKYVILDNSAISGADTTVYGLPKHKHEGPHELTVTTIPAQFTQEVYEVKPSRYVHIYCVYSTC
jgi:hypothetical protein